MHKKQNIFIIFAPFLFLFALLSSILREISFHTIIIITHHTTDRDQSCVRTEARRLGLAVALSRECDV